MAGVTSEEKEAVKGRLQELLPFDWELVRYALAEPVPRHLKKWWFCLGGTVMYLFIIQIITGIFLAFYYVPSPAEAYESVARITQEIRFGWYIRSLHRWSANFMIVAMFLHMLRVFFTGAYRHPRQLNWMIGVVLIGITLTFGFTGYSLVYEQLSFWGATVASNITEAVPLVGPTMANLMRGGPEVGPNTLTRFFMLHIAILPALAFILISLHILIIRLHGVTELYFEGEQVPEKERFFKFWPDHGTTELMVGTLLIYILTIISLIFPVSLGEPANPAITPEHIKPEWYFYFNFRLLKLTSLRMSVILTGILAGVFFFWPFIEALSRKLKIPERIPIILGVLAFLGFLTLTVWESFA
ncbi:cytochrome bc complex cytochrome b subunit [Planctomycetota bacterium]